VDNDRRAEASTPPVSHRASRLPPPDDVLHPRGQIWPPLPRSARRRDRVVRAFIRVGQGLQYHGAFRAAPAMAFHFFLSLLPLLAFGGYVLGLVARRSGVSTVLNLLLESAPATTQTVLKEEVSHLATANRLGPLAAIGFLWVASGGMHGLMEAVEAVVGAPRRTWWKKRLIALGWVIAALTALAVATFGLVEWDEVAHPKSVATQVAEDPAKAPASIHTPVRPQKSEKQTSSPKRVRRLLRSGGERTWMFGLSIVGAAFGLCAFYRLAVSHARSVRRRVLPGALAAVALWILVSWGFSLYLQTLASYTVYYGGLAAVAVLLVWLWLVSLSILVGAELNSQLEGLRDELPTES
jgi:membrane protein